MTNGKTYSIDFDRGVLVPLESPGLPVGAVVTYEDRANPRAEFAVVGDGFAGGYTDRQSQRVVSLEDGHVSEIHATAGKLSGGWRETGRVLTAEELAAALATAAENKARSEAEQKAAAEVRAQKRAAQRTRWDSEFAHLQKPGGKLSNHACGAKNIKTELARAFPGVKFSAKSDSFSGGDSIDVIWQFGPTTEAVEKITGKYQEGHFNGMEDIYEHDRENQWPDIYGGAKYVSESRGFPAEFHEQIGRALCILQKVEFSGQWTRNLMGQNDDRDLQQHVNELLGKTTFPVGFEFVRVESTDDGDCALWSRLFNTYGKGFCGPERHKLTPEDETALQGYESRLDRHWCRIKFKAAAQAAQEPAANIENVATATGNGATVKLNTEKNGVEIHFATKPAAAVLEQLKANGWRWSRFSSCWYQKQSAEALAFAHGLTGMDAMDATCPPR